MKQHRLLFTRVLLILFLANTVMLWSQTKDTLAVTHDLEHPFNEHVIDVFGANAYLLFAKPVQNFTQATLGASQENNSVRDAQTPSAHKNLYLRAKGVYSKNKTWLIGGLSIVKNYQNNVGHNLSNMLFSRDQVEKSPFFNLAYQQGDWNNQLYRVNGTLAHQFTDRFYATAGINYNVNQYFRTQNPTPKLTYLDLLAHVKLAYGINPKNTVGVSLSAGYMNNEIEISYIGNDSDLNLPVNDSIYNRISVGLGLLESAKTKNAKEKENTKGIGVFYVLSNNANIIKFDINYTQREHGFYEVFSGDNVLLGNYDVAIISSKINGFSFDKKTAISFENVYKKGDNFRVATNGKNYEASSFASRVNYIKTHTNNAFSFFTEFNALKKKDYQALNSFSFNNITFGGSYFRTFKLKKGSVYGHVATNFSFNTDKEEHYETYSKYIEQVTEPRVDILTATQTGFKLKAGYKIAIKSGIHLDYGAAFAMHNYLGLSSFKGLNNTVQLNLKITY